MGKVQHVWRNLFPKELIPYYCRYAISGTFVFPESFKKADYVGLLFAHLLEQPETTLLIAYWKDEESYRAQARAFENSLSVPAASEMGFATSLRLFGSQQHRFRGADCAVRSAAVV